MKKLNFKIQSNHAIDIGNSILDLHNNYDFNGLTYNVPLNTIRFSWIKTDADWVPKDHPANIQVIFEGVKFFKTYFNTTEQQAESDKLTLSFVGYLHPDDVDIMDGCLDEKEASNEFHIIFSFENGLSIKIYSENAKAEWTE